LTGLLIVTQLGILEPFSEFGRAPEVDIWPPLVYETLT
jgi:hypothetical protein